MESSLITSSTCFENESPIDERMGLHELISNLGYFPFLLLVLWWNFNILHGIKASCPICEAKLPHMLHVILLCCLRVRLQNSSHVKGNLRMNPTLMGEETLLRLSKLVIPHIGNQFYGCASTFFNMQNPYFPRCRLILSTITSLRT